MSISYKIAIDDMPMNPREWDNIGTILYVSHRYTLGDSKVSSEEIEEIASDSDNICLSVYAFMHGPSIALSTSDFGDKWDSGQCGIIYATKEDIRKNAPDGISNEELVTFAHNVFKAEIQTYSNYLNGDVYGYIITNDDTKEELESSWGFYSREDCEYDAKISKEYHVEQLLTKQATESFVKSLANFL
jgi:hypothetical protein